MKTKENNNPVLIDRNEVNKKAKVKNVIAKALIYLVLIIYALWILVPFAIVIFTSFKSPTDAMEMTFHLFPKEWSLEGYKRVFDYTSSMSEMPDMVRGFINTLLYIIPPTLLGLFTSSLAAFAFEKINFRTKKFLYTFLLMTMLIPGTIMIAPSYFFFTELGWTQAEYSFLPLMIPGMFGAAACVFFMRQYFNGVPNELVEAAKIDGLGWFGIFFRIIVPISLPALFAQGILGFVAGYNDYLNPLIYLQEPEYYSLQIALKTFAANNGTNMWIPSVMAATVIALLPTIIIYLVAQKFFIEGIVTSGIKM